MMAKAFDQIDAAYKAERDARVRLQASLAIVQNDFQAAAVWSDKLFAWTEQARRVLVSVDDFPSRYQVAPDVMDIDEDEEEEEEVDE